MDDLEREFSLDEETGDEAAPTEEELESETEDDEDLADLGTDEEEGDSF